MHQPKSEDADGLKNLVSSSSQDEPVLPVVSFPLSRPSAHSTLIFLEMTPYLFEKELNVRRLGKLNLTPDILLEMLLIWIQAKLLLNPTERVSIAIVSGSLSVVLPPTSDAAVIPRALHVFAPTAQPAEGQLGLVLEALNKAAAEDPEAPVAGILFCGSPAGPLPALAPNTRLDVVVAPGLTQVIPSLFSVAGRVSFNILFIRGKQVLFQSGLCLHALSVVSPSPRQRCIYAVFPLPLGPAGSSKERAQPPQLQFQSS